MTKLNSKKLVKTIRDCNDFILNYPNFLLKILMDSIDNKEISKTDLNNLKTLINLSLR